jgi:hypothetical protein
MNKKPKKTVARLIQNEESRTLEKLEAGLAVKIGDKNINDLYNEKLHQQVDLTETISQSIIKAKKEPKPKKEKPVKEVSVKGKQGTNNLSKYRQQVKEALELKKSIENKNTLIYSDDDDADDEDDEPIVPRTPAPPSLPVQPQVDLAPIFSELENIKKKNKELEDRFTYRSSILDLSNLRRNMSIKF